MAGTRFIRAFVLLLSCLILHACDYSDGGRKESVFKQVPEIREIKPQKPVKIKLKRSVNGNYSWDLTGDDAERVIAVDRKLKDQLK